MGLDLRTATQFMRFARIEIFDWRAGTAATLAMMAIGFTSAAALPAIPVVNPWVTRLGASVLFGLIGFIGWKALLLPPRHKGKNVGVAFAIRPETSEVALRLRSDFIDAVKSELELASDAPMTVLEIPDHLSPRITDGERADQLVRKARCHLLIWGGMRKRSKERGKEVYLLRLEGCVIHNPIEPDRSSALASEMRRAIPKKKEIDVAKEIAGFTVASTSIALSSKFIVALAAASSGDFSLSTLLLREVAEATRKPNGEMKKDPAVKHLKARAPELLCEVLYARAVGFTEAWSRDRNPAHLEAAENDLEELRRRGGETTNYRITKAHVVLTLRNDLAAAEALISKCQANSFTDPVWRLSRAFLFALRGRSKEALEMYEAVFNLELSVRNIMQVEDYIQWWVRQKGGPPVLWLLLALINHELKHDDVMASEDLEKFFRAELVAEDPVVIAKGEALKAALAEPEAVLNS